MNFAHSSIFSKYNNKLFKMGRSESRRRRRRSRSRRGDRDRDRRGRRDSRDRRGATKKEDEPMAGGLISGKFAPYTEEEKKEGRKGGKGRGKKGHRNAECINTQFSAHLKEQNPELVRLDGESYFDYAKRTGICGFFRLIGNCDKGNGCRFKHLAVGEDINVKEEEQFDPKDPYKKYKNESFQDFSRRTSICGYFYIDGFCSRFSACPFKHCEKGDEDFDYRGNREERNLPAKERDEAYKARKTAEAQGLIPKDAGYMEADIEAALAVLYFV